MIVTAFSGTAEANTDVSTPPTVDTTPPVINGSVGQPLFRFNLTLYIDETTPINLTVWDHSAIDVFGYRTWYNGSWSGWTAYTGNFSITGLGFHRIHARARDVHGNVGNAWGRVVVTDWTPIANAGPDIYLSEMDPTAYFNGSASTGLIYNLTSWAWVFGDGSSVGYGEYATHTYLADEGTYYVYMVVSNEHGQVDDDTLYVYVQNAPPDVWAGRDLVRYEGTAIHFQGSFNDTILDTHTIEWDLGNGVTRSGTLSFWYTYPDEGNYTVTLTVTDNDGGVGNDTIQVDIMNYAPIARVFQYGQVTGGSRYGSITVDEGEEFSFRYWYYDAGWTDLLTITLDMGDGTTPATWTDTSYAIIDDVYTYYDDGTYYINLSVEDEDGGSGMDTLTVHVNNVAPTVAISPDPSTAFEGDLFTFYSSVTDPGDDTFTYFWDFGDGTNATTKNAYHRYRDNGVYLVRLTVTDDDGGVGTATVSITVNNAAPTIDMRYNQTLREGEGRYYYAYIRDAGLDDTFMFDWDMGDGTTYTTYNNVTTSYTRVSWVYHVYVDDGNYTATCTVTDDDGASASDSVYVDVYNHAPVLYVYGNQTFIEYRNATIVVRFFDWGVLDNHTIFIDFGDGSMLTTTNFTKYATYWGQLYLKHFYADDGNYTVTVKVWDEDGGVAMKTFWVNVVNYEPVVWMWDGYWNYEGSTATFTGRFLDYGYADTHTFVWDFDDGTVVTSSSYTWYAMYYGQMIINHTFQDNGVYNVTLTVTDDDGGSGNDTWTITIYNVAPDVEAGEDIETSEGYFTYFDGSFFDPGAGDTHTIEWDFGDGTTKGGSLTPWHRYGDNGVYTVTLTVTDDDGGTDSDTLTVTVENLDPYAVVYNVTGLRNTVNFDHITVYEGMMFDYVIYYADWGFLDTLTIVLDMGDGTVYNWTDDYIGWDYRNYTYADNGYYMITLTVTDDDGGVGMDTLNVTVMNVAPVVEAGPDKTANEGAFNHFSGSFYDPGWLDTHTIEWDFGDGGTASGSLTPSHRYGDNGVYTVTLTVTDDDGGIGSDTLTMTIMNRPPTARVYSMDPSQPSRANITVDEGEMFDFVVWFSDLGWLDTTDVTLDMDDGTVHNWADDHAGIFYMNHTYADNGVYIVTLTVVDDDGGTGVGTMTVNVMNVPPMVDAGLNVTIWEGQWVHFNGSFYDPGADTHTYYWDFGDGGNTTYGLSPWHRYIDDGIYTVSLTVTDDDGGVGTDTLIVTVLNRAPVFWFRNWTWFADEGQNNFICIRVLDWGILDDHNITWDFGDGTVISYMSYDTYYEDFCMNYTWGDNGIYNVTITVVDDDGNTTFRTLRKYVYNVAPTVDAGEDFGTYEGYYTWFSGSFTDPGWLDTHTIEWDFGDGSTANGTLTPWHRYGDDGNYTVTLTVTDDDGGVGTDTLVVRVFNVAPYVNVFNSWYVDTLTVFEGEEFPFWIYFLDNGWLDILDIIIDLDDGSPLITWTDDYFGYEQFNHTYYDDGIYNISAIVEDDDGGIRMDNLTVIVLNRDPVVDAGEDITSVEGAWVIFNGSFYDPGIHDTHTISWTFDDGGTTNYGTTLEPWHWYVEDGIYNVTLTVVDDDGGVGTDTLVVTVENRNPNVMIYYLDDYSGYRKRSHAFQPPVFDEGESFDFYVYYFDPGRLDLLEITLDFGDGNVDTWGDDFYGWIPVTYTYGDNGIFNITLTVEDDDGGVGTDVLQVTVNNVAPTAEAGEDIIGYEGYEIQFNGSFTDPGWLDTHTFDWDFGDGNTASGSLTPTHRYGDEGVYTVTLTVTDDDGGSDSDSLTVSLRNLAPTAMITVWNETAFEGEEIRFRGWIRDWGYLDDHFVSLDFGDGEIRYTNLTNTYFTYWVSYHTYADEGTYNVTIWVQDDDGATGEYTVQVTILNANPIVDAGEDFTTSEGFYTNIFNGSFYDPGWLDTHTYHWDFGDGYTSTSLYTSHVFAENGDYTVTLTVTDNDGGVGTDTLVVTVENVAPSANVFSPGGFGVTSVTVDEGEKFYVYAYHYDRGRFDTVVIELDFDDGTTYTWNDDYHGNTLFNHTYADNGVYIITLTVTDDDGGVGTDTHTVTVLNVNPTAWTDDALLEGDEGEYLNFTGGYSDPGADTHTFEWDFGDGNTASGLDVWYAYGDNGIYTVTLTVTDDDGGVGTDTMTVIIENVAPTAWAAYNTTVYEGDTVQFYGYWYDPGIDDTFELVWSFGDGTVWTGYGNLSILTYYGTSQPNHTYNDAGNYTATFWIYDDDGGVDSATVSVTVLARRNEP